ncbi:hypothetical protein [Enterococcus mundtii]|uniref:hypothetical protein n=1 Tax=Enterococcus mundtii TaxID=53346 RepID=UPI0035C6DCC0
MAIADLKGLTISELARTMIVEYVGMQIDLAIYNEDEGSIRNLMKVSHMTK